MDVQQVLALAVVGLTVLLMVRSVLRKRRMRDAGCGGSCNCTSAQKTIRYGRTGGVPNE